MSTYKQSYKHCLHTFWNSGNAEYLDVIISSILKWNLPIKCTYKKTVSPFIFKGGQGFVANMINTTGATCGAGYDYSSGISDITPGFGGVCVAQSLVFYVVSCVPLFVCLSVCCFFLFLVMALSVYFRSNSFTVPLVSFAPLLNISSVSWRGRHSWVNHHQSMFTLIATSTDNTILCLVYTYV